MAAGAHHNNNSSSNNNKSCRLSCLGSTPVSFYGNSSGKLVPKPNAHVYTDGAGKHAAEFCWFYKQSIKTLICQARK